MCGSFYIGLIYFMLKGKSMLHYTNLFSPNESGKNDEIIKKLFLWIDFKMVRMRKMYCTKCKRIKNLKP